MPLYILTFLKKFWKHLLGGIVLIFAYFKFKKDDIDDLYRPTQTDSTSGAISPKDLERLTQDISRFAKAMGTHPLYRNSFWENDKEAFQILSDWRYFKAESKVIYEELTDRDFVSDIVNYLDDEYQDQLRSWKYI